MNNILQDDTKFDRVLPALTSDNTTAIEYNLLVEGKKYRYHFQIASSLPLVKVVVQGIE